MLQGISDATNIGIYHAVTTKISKHKKNSNISSNDNNKNNINKNRSNNFNIDSIDFTKMGHHFSCTLNPPLTCSRVRERIWRLHHSSPLRCKQTFWLKCPYSQTNYQGCQGLPLPGHRNNSSHLFSGDGNFLAVAKTLADMEWILKDQLETDCKDAQMTILEDKRNISCIPELVRTEIRKY